MIVIKFLVNLTIIASLAMAEGSDDDEVPAPPPTMPPQLDDTPTQLASHTTLYDLENCIIEPAPSNEELDTYFAWMDEQSKQWKDATQRKCKLVHFVYNLRDITAHNQRFKEGKETFERSIWEGTHLSFEEKIRKFAGDAPKEFQWRQLVRKLPNLPPPAKEIDYVKRSLISPAVSQGGCGSCWAVAAITPLEAQVRKCGISNETLSVQSMIDCCTLGCWGCSSGWPHWGYDWMKSTGVITNASYPYVSGRSKTAGNCSFSRDSIIARVSSYGLYKFPNGNATFIMQLLTTYGPVTAAFCLENSVFSYKSGVYRPPAPCTTPMHGVAIVGYGTDPVQGDYWLVKNSWGPGFGDNGFFKVARGSNECLIESNISIPFVAKLDGTPCP